MDVNINTQLDFTDYLIHTLILLKESMKEKPEDYTQQLSNIANAINNLYNIHDIKRALPYNKFQTEDIRDYILNQLL